MITLTKNDVKSINAALIANNEALKKDVSKTLEIENVKHSDEADHATTADYADHATTADGISDSVKQYIRNQNLVNTEFETLFVSKNENNPTVMPYDGQLYVRAVNNSYVQLQFRLNNHLFQINKQGPWSMTGLYVKKGDTMYIVEGDTDTQARWYKLRDYSDR